MILFEHTLYIGLAEHSLNKSKLKEIQYWSLEDLEIFISGGQLTA